MSKSNLEFILRLAEILGNDSPEIERRLARLEDAVFGLRNVAERPDVKPPEVKVKRATAIQHNRKTYEKNALDIVYDALTDKAAHVTTLQRKTGVKLRTVQSRCSELVSLGMAERPSPNHYRRVV